MSKPEMSHIVYGRMHVVCDECGRMNSYYPEEYEEGKEGPDNCAYCGAELIYGGYYEEL